MSVGAVVIMAAGQGTRMRSAVPKIQHPVRGRPMLLWPVEAALAARAERVVVVLGPGDDGTVDMLPEGVTVAVQDEPRGTGDAVLAAREAVAGCEQVIVLSGDTPLITAEFVAALAARRHATGAAMVMATMTLDDPTGYGRVVRDDDGAVTRVAETKAAGDATAGELTISEVNAGVYAFAGADLFNALTQIGAANAQGEYYLPDVIHLMLERGLTVEGHQVADPDLMLGVNSRVDLARAERALNARIVMRHQLNGVTVLDPATTWIDGDVEIGADTTILPGCLLRGATTIGGGCAIGPNATITDTRVDDGATVIHSHLVECAVGAGASVGPFAYLRPGATLGEDSKAGAFVEIKNSEIGDGAKIPHLSYIGDADVGAGSNLGAATITANYDGKNKHRTTIGRGVRTGVDTTFVAPVTVGDGAYTGAGSVITKDVPPDALAVARERQRVIEGYAKRKDDGNDSD